MDKNFHITSFSPLTKQSVEPGNTKAENAARFAPFENVLSALSDDAELMDELKERARRMEDV